ncbi:MAG: class I tRNA ligase family protein [Mycoplasmataceae bacterium]|nr:class I tRNA ligase family protein [Mycoplasmataceae bacterium]
MEKDFIYLCGPTVYNKVHIGNMRPIVTFDLILRGLKYLNNNIEFIHNITDIDDKIINQAQKENILEEVIANKYTDFYFQMLKEYNVTTVDFFPRVSEKINQIQYFIQKLIDLDYVYESNNSYYFRTHKISTYGEISNNLLDYLKNKKDLDDKKENPYDFVVWKNKTKGKVWDTTLGLGRPGWHTECAAFIYEKTKGKSLLIHGGGIDLKFPHHENENAQFKALTNKSICSNWIHVGIINYKNQKMSKSLGNIVYADDFLNKYKNNTNSSDLFRLMILSSSINSTIELNDQMIDSLIKKNNQINKIVNFVLLNDLVDSSSNFIDQEMIVNLSQGKFSTIYKKLNQVIKDFNSSKNQNIALELFWLISFLGFTCVENKITKEDINIYQTWQIELKNKNFEKADYLRKQLLDKGLI